MKTVYFVQHGIALPKEIDAQRRLSDQGRVETRAVASLLINHQLKISCICHSGKLRALQSAALFSDLLGVKDVIELACMNPNDPPSKLIDQLDQDAFMYVGHLPHIQKVVAQLITGDPDNPVIKFQNSTVACIEIEGETAALKWLITPELC